MSENGIVFLLWTEMFRCHLFIFFISSVQKNVSTFSFLLLNFVLLKFTCYIEKLYLFAYLFLVFYVRYRHMSSSSVDIWYEGNPNVFQVLLPWIRLCAYKCIFDVKDCFLIWKYLYSVDGKTEYFWNLCFRNWRFWNDVYVKNFV